MTFNDIIKKYNSYIGYTITRSSDNKYMLENFSKKKAPKFVIGNTLLCDKLKISNKELLKNRKSYETEIKKITTELKNHAKEYYPIDFYGEKLYPTKILIGQSGSLSDNEPEEDKVCLELLFEDEKMSYKLFIDEYDTGYLAKMNIFGHRDGVETEFSLDIDPDDFIPEQKDKIGTDMFTSKLGDEAFTFDPDIVSEVTSYSPDEKDKKILVLMANKINKEREDILKLLLSDDTLTAAELEQIKKYSIKDTLLNIFEDLHKYLDEKYPELPGIGTQDER